MIIFTLRYNTLGSTLKHISSCTWHNVVSAGQCSWHNVVSQWSAHWLNIMPCEGKCFNDIMSCARRFSPVPDDICTITQVRMIYFMTTYLWSSMRQAPVHVDYLLEFQLTVPHLTHCIYAAHDYLWIMYTLKQQNISLSARNPSFWQAHAFEVLTSTSTYRQFIICMFIPSKILSSNIISCTFIYNANRISKSWEFYRSRPFARNEQSVQLVSFPAGHMDSRPSTWHTTICLVSSCSWWLEQYLYCIFNHKTQGFILYLLI